MKLTSSCPSRLQRLGPRRRAGFAIHRAREKFIRAFLLATPPQHYMLQSAVEPRSITSLLYDLNTV
jgi:hypothetical protein